MNYSKKYLKYKTKYLELIGGRNMQISNSNNKIKTNIDNIFISHVDYETCGMTVVSSPNWIDYYIDKRGKNVYGMGTDMLYGNTDAETYAKAICLVGGSTLGLEGICGVNQALIQDKENNPNNGNVPAIGAACYSLNIFEKDYTHPDIKLGKFAYENKSKDLMIGKVGAGVNTRVGKLYADMEQNMFYAGQGADYLEKDKMKCFCIVVLNCLGVVHENGKLLHPFKTDEKIIEYIADMPENWLINSSVNKLQPVKKLEEKRWENIKSENKKINILVSDSTTDRIPTIYISDSSVSKLPFKRPGNTTLTIFVTNIEYDELKMKELSKELHDVVQSMVYPYGTLLDGDIFFLASSKEFKSDIDYLSDYKTVIRNAIKSPFTSK